MSSPANHWKLGLFLVTGLVLALVTVLVLGAHGLGQDEVSFTTYYDESVQGLEVGSPVKLRGVTIGSVVKIGIAPDRRHVEVISEVDASRRAALGLDGSTVGVDAGLRVQLAVQGITGVKFLQVDFFDPERFPPPTLPFPAPERYVPAAVSTMKSVEDSVVKSVDRLPEVADAVVRSAEGVDRMMATLEAAALPAATAQTLARAERVLALLERQLGGLDAPALAAQARRTLANVDAAAQKAGRVLERFDGDQGLVASMTRTSDAVGDLAAGDLVGELPETLRALRLATAAIGRLAETLELDSDMLLKGRSKGR